jgi:hypothetical protein
MVQAPVSTISPIPALNLNQRREWSGAIFAILTRRRDQNRDGHIAPRRLSAPPGEGGLIGKRDSAVLFTGTGTMAIVVGFESGRRFMGCDVDEKMVAIASRRIIDELPFLPASVRFSTSERPCRPGCRSVDSPLGFPEGFHERG